MRIIGGKYQRRHIIAPVKLPVRPTTDMAKEALFSIINNHFDFEQIQVLDLFAGTGNISYEFASRGALEVIAVDMNNHCVQFIRQTVDKLGMENLRPVRAEAFHFLSFCSVTFDIVFADPPYDFTGIKELPTKVLEANILNAGGWFILEHGERQDFTKYPGYSDTRKYGKVHFSFFRLPDVTEE
jgi:16S rRNA (guanine966-N2)-methyltransferase